MRQISVRLDGPFLLEAHVHQDERGFFLETYHRDVLAGLGIGHEMVQYNHSRSHRGVLRGMHYQPGMGKLVRCARGRILDVVVDIRRGSPQFGEWEIFELDDVNHRQVYCPDGFGHGFCVLSEWADVVYGCTTYWDRATEGAFHFDDPAVGISWPSGIEFTVSEKDAAAPTLTEISAALPVF